MKRAPHLLSLATLAIVAGGLVVTHTEAAPPSNPTARQVFRLRLSKKTASRQSKGQSPGPKQTASRVTARRRPGTNLPLTPSPGLAPLPDLYIADVVKMENEGYVPRFVAIGNKGKAPVHGFQFQIRYVKWIHFNQIKTVGLYTVNVPQTLAPGAVRYVRPPRNHIGNGYRVRVDPANRIRESNETNNDYKTALYE